MLDAHYENPKLVELYDLDSGWSIDREYYLALANGTKMKILDLGCGTGLLANAYASKNHKVTGVDPSKQMLKSASNKTYGDKVEWVQSSSQKFSTEKQFDLIVMTGHAFQVLLSDQDIKETIATMHKHMLQNGRLVFESRNPEINWAANWNYELEIELPEYKVKESRQFLYMDKDRMIFELKYQFPDETLVSKSELRFLSVNEIKERLEEQGLKIENIYGDWSESLFKPDTSEEMIFVLRK